MMTIVSVEGIRCYAGHGCLEEEQKIGGWFLVDVHIEADFSRAVHSDRLEETLDYVLITNIIREQMAIPSRLIEHVGGRILQKLQAAFPGKKCIELKITKLNPPVNSQIGSASVTLEEDFE